jgi:gliding motility-associated-like protein
LTATDTQGLSATATVSITVDLVMAASNGSVANLTQEQGNHYIQKILSPNNDGICDTWVIDKQGEIAITVFNRMGQIVYQSDNYRHNWDGTSKDGAPLPAGTYFYQIILKETSELITGVLNIVK